MMFRSVVVRHKTEGGKLDVAPIKRDCKITQQPDKRLATRTRNGEMEAKPERKRTAAKTGHGEKDRGITRWSRLEQHSIRSLWQEKMARVYASGEEQRLEVEKKVAPQPDVGNEGEKLRLAEKA